MSILGEFNTANSAAVMIILKYLWSFKQQFCIVSTDVF